MSEDAHLSGRRPGHPRGKATRQLCAGVYFDREFRDSVIWRVLLDPAHRVAPSYGFDLVPVVGHAKRALMLEICERLGFLSVFVGAWVALPALAITVGCFLLLWLALRRLVRTLPTVGRLRALEAIDDFMHRARYRSHKRELKELRREAKLVAMACLGLLVVPFLAAALQHQPVENVLRTAAMLIAALALFAFTGAASRRLSANRMWVSESLGTGRLSRRMKRIREQQESAYAIYRRPVTKTEDEDDIALRLTRDFDEPQDIFVGAGELVHKWLPPLIVPLLPEPDAPEGEESVRDFEPDALIDALQVAIEEVGGGGEPGSLPGLSLGDRIYAEEMVLSNDRGRLRRPLDPEERRKIINAPYGHFHHFLEISTSPTGEVVVTVFVRVTIKARTLCLDFAACALTRLPRDYEKLDHYGERGWASVVRAGLAAIWRLPDEILAMRRLVGLPRLLLGWLLARVDWTVLPHRGSAVGTAHRVREECATPWGDAEHDRAEILGLMKIIEQRLLWAAEKFLEGHGVDTSDFKKRAQTIISANVLNMGGRMDIRDSAIGPNASRANQQQEPDDQENGE
ncbi:hypothetical protein [Nonomuraea jabiensis]|uniref:Uncharacterized protein n=1 Tax=Nonomuraea jabiensis TaxID=882448 RepID=A0A7W9FXT8_9ACTN|nr:hypothetical protein [Nonomuraea jabiensis]MBB5773506.1 hypothetical protein [Nonomuraea jabiensis]